MIGWARPSDGAGIRQPGGRTRPGTDKGVRMEERTHSSPSVSRRQFLRAALVTGSVAMAVVANPTGLLASPTQVATSQVIGLQQVPREQTLVTVRGGTQGKFIEDQLWNPFIPTANH